MKRLKTVMASAISYLVTLPPEEIVFARLLHDKNESALLNKNRFDFYSTVVTAAAQYENSTFDNYFISLTDSHQRIARLVKNYLTNRDKLLAVSTSERSEANMTETEKKKILEVALKEFGRDLASCVEEKDEVNVIKLTSDKVTLIKS